MPPADDSRFVEVQDEQQEPQDGEAAPEEAFSFDEEADNLVTEFQDSPEGREALRAIADMVHRDYTSDWESSEEYRKRFADDWRLFAGDLPPKEPPFQDMANAHVPLMLENLVRVHTHWMDAIFGDWSSIVEFTKIGLDDERAEVLSIHTNFQLIEETPDFCRQMERGLLMYLVAGDVTFHSYYDSYCKTNRHDALTCDEFVIPFVFTTTADDYSDCPHRTKILRYYRHQLQAMRGEWEGIDEVLRGVPPQWDAEPVPTFRLEQARSTLIAEPDDNVQRPYLILQYEGWDQGNLPGQERDRFIQVIMEEKTRNILKLTIHEKVNWREQARFDGQMAEKTMYEQAVQMHGQMMEQFQVHSAIHAEQKGQFQAAADHMAMHGRLPNDMPPPPDPGPDPQAPPEPPMPGWMKSPSDNPPPPVKEPVNLFTHAVFIENLTGSLGLGAGRVQADHNRAVNVMLGQTIDQATMSNAKSFIKHQDVTFDGPGGAPKFSPGAVTNANGIAPDALKNALVQLDVGPANPQLMQLIQEIWGWGQSSMNAQDVLSGAEGKSGETWRGIAARLEQASKQLAVPARKFTRAVKQIAKNNCDLNALFLEEGELRTMFDYKTKLGRPITLSPKLYQRDLHIQVKADLRFATKAQRIAEADELVQMPAAVPMLAGNAAFVYQAIAGSLRARDRDDMIPALGQPPPPPPVFGMMPMPPPGAPPPGAPGAGPPGPPKAGPPKPSA